MKKKVIVIASFIAAVIILISIGIHNKNKAQVKQVKVSQVKKGDIKSYLSTTGIIKSKNIKDYYGTQLKIEKINIKVGDVVNIGQSLLSYDVSDLSNQVKQAEVQYNNAVLQKEDLINQRDNINNKISNLNSKIIEAENSKDPSVKSTALSLKQQRDSITNISDEKIEQAENSQQLAKSNLDTANSKLNSVNQGIVSQINGTVTALNVVEGGMANPAQVAVTIQDLNSLKSVVSLGKYDVNKIKVGQEAVIKTSVKNYNGKVSFLNPAASKPTAAGSTETTLSADIDVLDKAENLKIDFDTDVDIILDSKNNVLKIPVEAVKTDKGGKNYVFYVENGVAKKKEVKIGIKSDTEAEITEGLSANNKVILNPSSSIENGVKIKES